MGKSKSIIMLGTDYRTKGGVSSVVNVYRDAGLFQRYPVRYLPTHCDGGALAKLKVLLSAWLSFMGLLLTGRVGLVHCHTASRASFWRKTLFLVPAFLAGVPGVLHLHGAEFAIFYGKESGPLKQRLIRWVFNKCQTVVVLSDAWKTWAKGIGVTAPIEAIYNPVLLPAARDWERRTPGELLFLGRLGRRKGSFDLLTAAAAVPASPGASLRLLMGGDGELDEVRKRADALGLSGQLQLLGWVRGADKEAHLSSAWMYCLPSYNEGLPMSVLEAMAAGLPIITTPVGGIPEAVTDGVEGFLVEPGDVARLTHCIAQLIGDPALARRMGDAARRKVEATFSSDAVLPRVERLYREAGFQPR